MEGEQGKHGKKREWAGSEGITYFAILIPQHPFKPMVLG
jgi:hypothetical protein